MKRLSLRGVIPVCALCCLYTELLLRHRIALPCDAIVKVPRINQPLVAELQGSSSCILTICLLRLSCVLYSKRTFILQSYTLVVAEHLVSALVGINFPEVLLHL